MDKGESLWIGPLISIKSNQQKGLEINWNIKRVFDKKDFQIYHLFLVIGNSKKQQKQFIDKYYKKMAIGQLIGLAYMRQKQNSQISICWQEKMNFPLQQNFVKLRPLVEKFQIGQIQKIIDNLQNRSGLILINILFLSDRHAQRTKNTLQYQRIYNLLKDTILKIRKQNPKSIKFIFNIISENIEFNLLDCKRGMNIFKYNRDIIQQTCNELQKYKRSISLSYLKITISLGIKSLFLSINNDDWEILTERSIMKQYFALPSFNFKEYLILTSAQLTSQLQFLINIDLEFSFYNQLYVISSKQLTLTTTNSLLKTFSCNLKKNNSNYIYLGEGNKLAMINFANQTNILRIFQNKSN